MNYKVSSASYIFRCIELVVIRIIAFSKSKIRFSNVYMIRDVVL